MCGIFGYVGGERADAAQLVLEGLKRLEYRGYDSWGIAVASDARIAIERAVGKIGEAATTLPASAVGLGHTRWATQGAVTRQNAHPQIDCAGRLALVHNGIVANDAELRTALARAGHQLRSQTDSELIAHLIEDLLAQTPAGEDQLARATAAAFQRLRGLNAIVVLDQRSGRLAAAKSGSPLVVGRAEHGYFIASDAAALLPHTRSVAFLEEGQYVALDRADMRLWELATGAAVEPAWTELSWQPEAAERGHHPDYMTKETHEQPELLRALSGRVRDGVRALAERIERSREVFAIGCGSGAHAALAAQHLFSRVARRRVTYAPASEFECYLPFVGPETLVLALSQSGETIDVLDAVHRARGRGAHIAALTNVQGSSLWRLADLTLPLGVGPERCVLSTKSLSAKLAVVYLTAHALIGQLDEAERALERVAEDFAGMLREERREPIHEIARAIQAADHLYVLGRGPSYAIALETALKIKEVSYIHAEGFASGELKHGVIALIEPGTPCIAIVPKDDTEADVLAGALQVKARGATLIGIGPERHSAFDHHIPVADLGDATLIVNALPAQLLGYDLARLRGRDPDMPRNLAKSVTVK